ncbi:hypothetical protein KQI63_05840 [bacterium]|nr:hypothetical protein [bacterium]
MSRIPRTDRELRDLGKIQQELAAISADMEHINQVEHIYQAAAVWGITSDERVTHENRDTIAEYCLKRGVDNLFFLSKYILNYTRLEDEPHRNVILPLMEWGILPESSDEEAVQLMEAWPGGYPRTGLWVARGCFKTTLSIAQDARDLLADPDNERILLTAIDLGFGAKYITELQGKLVSSEVRHFFGPQKGTPWNDQEMTLASRRVIRKEPSFMVTAPGASQIGSHVTKLNIDDMYDEGKLRNPEVAVNWLAIVERHIRALYSIADEPGARIAAKMTRWHRFDIYNFFKEELKDLPDGQRFRILKAPAEVVQNDGTRVSFFPKKYTPVFLDERRRIEGPELYATQYELEPHSPSDRAFATEWLGTWEQLPDVAAITLTCDPATSKTLKSDFTALVVIYRTSTGHRYIVDGLVDKLTTPSARAKAATGLMKKHPAIFREGRVAWEAFGFQNGDLEALKLQLNEYELEMKKEDPGFTIGTRLTGFKREDNPGSKPGRIYSMVARTERHGYLIPPKGIITYHRTWDDTVHDLRQDLLRAYENFPFNPANSGEWDLLDAVQFESIAGFTPYVDTSSAARDTYEDEDDDIDTGNPFANRMNVTMGD